MIDFTLTPAQTGLRLAAQGFATNVLSKAPSIYNAEPTPDRKFQSTRPIYAEAVKGGLLKGQIPTALGGTGGSLIDAAILVEELYAVECSPSLTILGTGLGLTPLILAGSPEQQKRLFKPFLEADGTGEDGTPMASLVFSEPTGSANWVEVGGERMRTTARREGEEWVVSGEKIWATNSAGWDFKGANLQCVVCRRVEEGTEPAPNPRDDAMIIMVTREDIARNKPDAFTVLAHPPTVGHTAVSGPHQRFHELRVPAANVLCPPGQGVAVLEATFTGSAVIVGAMAVGVMRRSFNLALAFAKKEARGGSVPILQRQSVADLLINIKMRCEASRSLVWRAAYALEQKGNPELAYETKIHCADAAVQSVVDAMNAVGVSSYHADMDFGTIMNDALCLPLFDGGNIGIRRRQVEAIFGAEGYDPWAATYGPNLSGPPA